jgi:hypothetical protein
MTRGISLSTVFVSVAIFLAVSPLRADITGTILGVVTDPSGAAVPGASVSLRNSSTGLTRQTTTDPTGSYEFLAVPIGSDYSVAVEAQGFRKSTQTGITLLVNQRYRADFQLLVGTVTQRVEVSAAAAQVETTSTQLGDVIGASKMESLPLNGRSYLDLLGLQSGVIPITSGMEPTDRPVSGTIANAGYFSVNGNREAANSFLINGGDVEEGRLNGAEVVPTLDSLQEFRLLTNSFDAEYGRFAGGVINAVTKSGTNGFHGSLFEFLRNDDLDSRNFFAYNQYSVTGQELPGTARGAFKQNQFGAAVGGPIIKNRMFFFSDYQGTRQVLGVESGIIHVPSASERTGDFSDVATTGYAPLTGSVRGSSTAGSGSMDEVLTSRLGYTVTSGEPYWVSGCTTLAQAQVGMCVFPGQVIPQAAWGPVAKAVMTTTNYIPMAVASPGGVPIYTTTAYPQRVRDDKIGERIDISGGRTGSWTYYQHFDDSNLAQPWVWGNVPGFPATTLTRAQQFMLSNTRNFGGAAVNEARLNFTRLGLHNDQPSPNQPSISALGFQSGASGAPGLLDAAPPMNGMPYISFSQLGFSTGKDEAHVTANNTYQAMDSFSLIYGKHTMKFGGEYRFYEINGEGIVSAGEFGFAGGETGNDFADFLLDAPDTGTVSSNKFLYSRTKYGGAYAQDTFKIKSNFTLNYGLRWDVSQPYYDVRNLIQTFVPGEQSKVFPGAPTGWVFPSDPGIPSTLAPTRYDNFAPRLGLAYSPGFSDGLLGKLFGGPGKTSIRAGSGIYYTAIEDLTLFYELGDAPFALYFPIPGLVYLDEPFKSRISAGGAGQRFPFTPPTPGSPVNWAEFLPIGGSPGVQNNNELPYAEHFNFTIQRELARSTILSLAYVGTRGHRLIAGVEFNPGSAAKCEAINAQLATGATPCGPFGEDVIYTLSNGTNANGTRPYSVTSGYELSQGLLDFSDNSWYSAMANSNYNSLQTSLQRSVGAFTFLAAYTYAKAMDNASGLADQINPFNYRVSKSLSSFDMTHNFVMSYNYTLPLERLTSSGPLRKFLQGWQVSGITRFTTGLPVTLGESDDHSLCGCNGGTGQDYPNYNNQPLQYFNPRKAAYNQYFSTTQFTPEAIGQLGDANRRFFHGPGLNNWDLAAHKVTNITERIKLEFRAEFFNIFNHAQFTSPAGTVNATSSFGDVLSANDPRIGQMALKLFF